MPINNKHKEHPTLNRIPNHMHMSNNGEKVQQVYKLPSTKQVIRYYHAAAGFPTKATLLRQ